MTFEPRVRFGRTMASKKLASSMIDLSDGLSRDLAHICRESGVGAVVNAFDIPIHADAIEMRRDGHSPLEHALHDGEDYELLHTSKAYPSEYAVWPDGVSHRIGEITAAPGIWLRHRDGSRTLLEPKSWQHTF
jgi:thiamine-monophosphate kinase